MNPRMNYTHVRVYVEFLKWEKALRSDLYFRTISACETRLILEDDPFTQFFFSKIKLQFELNTISVDFNLSCSVYTIHVDDTADLYVV